MVPLLESVVEFQGQVTLDEVVRGFHLSLPRYVVQGGVVHDASTLDQLWPRQRRFVPKYWLVPLG